MKIGENRQDRYELQCAVLLKSHQQLDEKINDLLKDNGYQFLYSSEAKPIIQHLEEAKFYDQAAIELSQQVSKDQPIVFKEIKLIIDESILVVKDYLSICEYDTPALPEFDSRVAFWEKPWISDELKSLLFAQPNHLSADSFLNTYLIIDATLYTEIYGVFNLDLFSDLPIQCLYKGGREQEKVAPYLIDMTLQNLEYDSLREEVMYTPSFHKDFFKKFWGKGTGIFIRTTANMDDTSKHLRKFTKVQHPEGQRIFFFYHLPHVATQYFNNIKTRLAPCKSWFQPKADNANIQILCERKHGLSIQVFEGSNHLKEDTTSQKAFVMAQADMDCFQKTKIEKDTIHLATLLKQDFTAELSHLTLQDVTKIVKNLVERMQTYQFTLRENFYLLSAWEIFFGEHFETKDIDNELQKICQSQLTEAEKMKQLIAIMDQLSVSTPTL
jgi:hypothetical protein